MPNPIALTDSTTHTTTITIQHHVSELDKLENVLFNGSKEESDQAFIDLLSRCTCPGQENTPAIKLMLLNYLEKQGMTEDVSLPCDENGDVDLVFEKALKQCLFSEYEQLIPANQLNWSLNAKAENYQHNCSDSNAKIASLKTKNLAIYAYFQSKIQDLDAPLLDEAYALYLCGHFEEAWSICQVLSTSHDDRMKSAARRLYFPGKPFLSSEYSPNHQTKEKIRFYIFQNILHSTAALSQPKTALLCALYFFESEPKGTIQGIGLLTELAANQNEIATRALNELANTSKVLITLQVLSEIYGDCDFERFQLENSPKSDDFLVVSNNNARLDQLCQLRKDGCLDHLKNSQLAASLKEKAQHTQNALKFQEGEEKLRINQQFYPLNISFKKSLSERYEEGIKNLASPDTRLRGIEILEPLSQLDPCFALEAKNAKQALENWFANASPAERLKLIRQYGFIVIKNVVHLSHYETTFQTQCATLLKQIQSLKKAGKKEEAQGLIHNLIDLAIELELPAGKKKVKQGKNEFISAFYQCLIDHDAIDDSYTDELTIRQQLCEKKSSMDDSKVLQCLISAADTLNRPLAAYQLGQYYFPKDLKNNTDVVKDHIKNVAYYFQKADKEGYSPGSTALGNLRDKIILLSQNEIATDFKLAKDYLQVLGTKGYGLALNDLADMDKTLDEMTKKADEYKNAYTSAWLKNIGDLDEAVRLYQWASTAGSSEAKLSLLQLLALDEENLDAQSKLGRLYLTGSTDPNLQQDLNKAHKLLDSAARGGNAAAAILLACHYSRHTENEPKFTPPFDIFILLGKDSDERANEKAWEYFQLAREHGIPQKLSKQLEATLQGKSRVVSRL